MVCCNTHRLEDGLAPEKGGRVRHAFTPPVPLAEETMRFLLPPSGSFNILFMLIYLHASLALQTRPGLSRLF